MNSLSLLAASTSSASTAQTSALGGWLMPVIMIGFIAIMYFLLIRPQKKKEKEEAKMRNEIELGDDIVTIGGIYGRVVSFKDEDKLVIESSGDRSKIMISRAAVSQNFTVHDTTPSNK